MPSRIVRIDGDEFAGMTYHERICRVVIDLLKEDNFAGRVDMSLDDWYNLERTILSIRHPLFQYGGTNLGGTVHMQLAIAGASAAIYPNAYREDGAVEIEVRK